jgi:aspartyl-tRNA(Asn)/glutamyl-tRNA(Gln) amidotransferase subunit C
MKKISNLSEEEVKHIAKLANLTLAEEEIKKFQSQLSEVLNYMDVLKKLETKEIEPTSQVTGLENIFRDDETGLCLQQKEVLSNTKEKNNGLFVIEAIFKKEEK